MSSNLTKATPAKKTTKKNVKYGNAKVERFKTREDWLNAAIKELHKDLFAPFYKSVGLTPKNWTKPIRVTCGFPFGSRGGKSSDAIGQCFHFSVSKDKSIEIVISPMLDQVEGHGETANPKKGKESQGVLDVLAHELIHAHLDNKGGHGPEFRAVAVGIGLAGHMTATIPSEDLKPKLAKIHKKLGAYPHAGMNLEELKRRRKTQGTRLVKVVCTNKECNTIFRMTRGGIEKAGLPKCGCGSKTFLDD